MSAVTRKKTVADSTSMSSKKQKTGSYCVLENEDGGRIMTSEAATEFMASASADKGSWVMHCAANLAVAKEIQKACEERLKLDHGLDLSDDGGGKGNQSYL